MTAPGILHVEPVMGTTVTFDVRDTDRTAAELAPAVLAGVAALHEADRTFSTYRPDSVVSRLRDGTLAPGDVAAEVVDVLARCTAAAGLTDGWFDAWAMPGGVDPTGLVKGWAAQRALVALPCRGVRHAVVNAGGDVAVVGDASGAADGSGWVVGVQDPFRRDDLLATVHSVGLGVATSGAYERGSLAVDPRSGTPVHRLASATVVGVDLGVADACSTAASAHGPEALAWLSRADGVEALLVTLDGVLLATPGWSRLTAAARTA